MRPTSSPFGFLLLSSSLVSLAFAGWQGEPASTSAIRPSALELAAGERLTLTLGAEITGTWAALDVRRVVVRSAGTQRSIVRSRLPDSRELVLQVGDRGCTLVVVDIGVAGRGVAEAADLQLTRSTKTIACRIGATLQEGLDARLRSASSLTAKTGGFIEVQPLNNPSLVRSGSDLAVRLYFQGTPQPGEPVVAVGPGGARLTTVTDAIGAASFRISWPGMWVIRFTKTVAAGEHVGELIFEVGPDEIGRGPGPGR